MIKLNDGAIRRLRQRKCWSQEDLADRAGVSVRTLQRLENGDSARMDTIALIAEALEVSPTDILDTSAPTAASQGGKAATDATKYDARPVPVVLRRITVGKELLDCATGAFALLPSLRGIADAADAELVGGIFDGLRDYGDIGSDMSFTDQLRYGADLTERLTELGSRGWWILAGKRRHALSWSSSAEPTPWITCVVIAARADDSIVQHREDGEPVAFVVLPRQYNLA